MLPSTQVNYFYNILHITVYDLVYVIPTSCLDMDDTSIHYHVFISLYFVQYLKCNLSLNRISPRVRHFYFYYCLTIYIDTNIQVTHRHISVHCDQSKSCRYIHTFGHCIPQNNHIYCRNSFQHCCRFFEFFRTHIS